MLKEDNMGVKPEDEDHVLTELVEGIGGEKKNVDGRVEEDGEPSLTK